ncbi:MAG: SDR family oxidoreductase, partial [Planctomycetota bacterium]
TKASQNVVCRSLRHELRPHGIEVASVHPITTRTAFFERSQTSAGRPVPNEPVPGHTPRLFVQTPDRVARAVVACLHRPRAEVWTSTIVRMTSAMMTAFPAFADRVMAKSEKADRAPD